jgi:putative endonuclease
MATDSRKSLGRLGEQLAADHFERLGWEIVERNYQTRFGELDLVAIDGDTLVFAEVKTCRLGRGQPWDSLHDRKQAQVRKVSGMWFSERAGTIPFWEHVRFDAIGVLIDDRDALVRLDHLEGAF